MTSQERKDAELASIAVLNDHLRAEFLCCPPYGSINGQWVREAFNLINENSANLMFHVTAEVISPWRRAFQSSHMYFELGIVKPFRYLIDAATLCLLEGNWVCAHLSLIPIIEGVLEAWRVELKAPTNNRDRPLWWLHKFLAEDVSSKLDMNIYLHQHLKIQCDFLIAVLKEDFFESGDKHIQREEKNFFNRNVTIHMLEVPTYTNSGICAARLFLMLDIICALYLHTNYQKYTKLGGCIFNNVTNEAEHSIYFDIFKKCATSAIYSNNINALHNLLYKNGA